MASNNVRVRARKAGAGGAKVEISFAVDEFTVRMLRSGTLPREAFREAFGGEIEGLLNEAVDDIIKGRFAERVPRGEAKPGERDGAAASAPKTASAKEGK